MSATNPEATAGPSQITITVRRPRVAVGAVLWTGIMLSAVLALTYTHSFANYGRPDARVEDEDRGAPITRTHGDLSDAGEDDDDRDEEVDDDEDEGEEEDEEASLTKPVGERRQKTGLLHREGRPFPQRISVDESSTSTFFETLLIDGEDELQSPHTSVNEHPIGELQGGADDGQQRINSAAEAQAASGRSISRSSADPNTASARRGDR